MVLTSPYCIDIKFKDEYAKLLLLLVNDDMNKPIAYY